MLETFSSPVYSKQKRGLNARVILYGDGKARQTRHSIWAILGDQQVYIAFFFKEGAYF